MCAFVFIKYKKQGLHGRSHDKLKPGYILNSVGSNVPLSELDELVCQFFFSAI